LTIDNINKLIAKNGQATFELVGNIDAATAPEATAQIGITLDVSQSLFYDSNSNEITVLG